MEIDEIKKKIKHFDFNFLRYINQETKELGNKVILFSSIIIFLNFNYMSISELEIIGFKIPVDKINILPIILLLINFYYFLQFQNSSKIDYLLAKLPDNFEEISTYLTRGVSKITSDMDLLAAQYQKNIETKNFDNEETLSAKSAQLKDTEIVEILKSWTDVTTKGLNYHKRNRLLNQIFPAICFFLSVLSYAFLLYKKYCT